MVFAHERRAHGGPTARPWSARAAKPRRQFFRAWRGNFRVLRMRKATRGDRENPDLERQASRPGASVIYPWYVQLIPPPSDINRLVTGSKQLAALCGSQLLITKHLLCLLMDYRQVDVNLRRWTYCDGDRRDVRVYAAVVYLEREAVASGKSSRGCIGQIWRCA